MTALLIVPKVVVTTTVPPEVVKLDPNLFFNCTVIVEVVRPSASIDKLEAVMVDFVASAGSNVNATGTVAVAVVPLIENPKVAVPTVVLLVKVVV